MYILVQHTINDADTFWGMAKDLTDEKKTPAGIKLHFGLPSTDTKQAVCLWEGPSVDAIKNHLEPAIGKVSRNIYYAVNNEKAVGLPLEPARR